MRNNFGFKKEWLHFTRTFRFGGILIAIFSLALANPLLYKAMIVMLQAMGEMPEIADDPTGAMTDITAMTGEAAALFDSASTVFSLAMAELCATAVLVIMLIMMSPCGGEQKKRATIIPACSGLEYKDYLLPKYVLYPSVIFAAVFTVCILAGLLSNALFVNDIMDFGTIALASLFCSIYIAFMFIVYMSIGICTSRPGVTTVLIYIGQTLITLILTSMGLTRFNPFTLRSLVIGEMFMEDFSLADEMTSIIVAIVLSVVIAVLMFFLTLAVLGAKKINNQENKPEF